MGLPQRGHFTPLHHRSMRTNPTNHLTQRQYQGCLLTGGSFHEATPAFSTNLTDHLTQRHDQRWVSCKGKSSYQATLSFNTNKSHESSTLNLDIPRPRISSRHTNSCPFDGIAKPWSPGTHDMVQKRREFCWLPVWIQARLNKEFFLNSALLKSFVKFQW